VTSDISKHENIDVPVIDRYCIANPSATWLWSRWRWAESWLRTAKCMQCTKVRWVELWPCVTVCGCYC